MKKTRKGKIPIRLNLKEARKSRREAQQKLKRPKPQISEVHAAIWGAPPRPRHGEPLRHRQ
jgi:hypothetical protein